MNLEDAISPGRLHIYTDILKLKQEEVLGAYNWNKALCSSMQPLLHCLEVTLRNSIDCAIRHNPPPGATGLWRTDQAWIFDLPRYIGDRAFIRQRKRYKTDVHGNILHHNGQPLYLNTVWEEECIRKVSHRIKSTGKRVTATRILSGLGFGFWTSLLSFRYEEPRNNSLLWPHLLCDVFPCKPGDIPRWVIEQKFIQIRELRNRLFHHEAIWKFHYRDPETGKSDYRRPIYGINASLQLLQTAWKDMLEALYWINPLRYTAFLSEGHQQRFTTLASRNGLLSYIKPEALHHCLDITHSQDIKTLLRDLNSKNAKTHQP
ncbi:Abi family protein [Jejubacter sp. L23]|uniref:Abi family protein n=1 Tax=Jejubacter sp. L23 TaxID=3092086 RepID=UPI003D71F0FE